MKKNVKKESFKSLKEFIDYYDHFYDMSIDASPFGIQKTTIESLVKKLKTIPNWNK